MPPRLEHGYARCGGTPALLLGWRSGNKLLKCSNERSNVYCRAGFSLSLSQSQRETRRQTSSSREVGRDEREHAMTDVCAAGAARSAALFASTANSTPVRYVNRASQHRRPTIIGPPPNQLPNEGNTTSLAILRHGLLLRRRPAPRAVGHALASPLADAAISSSRCPRAPCASARG